MDFVDYIDRDERYPVTSRASSPLAYAVERYQGYGDLRVVRVDTEQSPDGTTLYRAIRSDGSLAGVFVEHKAA